MFTQVFIGCDHAGINLKQSVIALLNSKKIPVYEVQMQEDYTDVAKNISNLVASSKGNCGILICGSGAGVCITANRTPNIRAVASHSVKIAELCRMHNNANVLCLGARMLEEEAQIEIVKTFLDTKFEGGRHLARINKIDKNEE